jgi:uncharacterized protein YjbI with pentapeptide repeats
MTTENASDKGSITEGVADILMGDLNRLDDLAAASGLQPDRAWVGMNLKGAGFIGTPERPIDLRGWNFTRCDLTGVKFEHVLMDENTIFDEANLTDIGGADAEDVLRQAGQASSPAP